MPRYIIKRTFPTGLAIPMNGDGAAAIAKVNAVNAAAGVTWSHSYVSDDKKTTFCIYDGPSPTCPAISWAPTSSLIASTVVSSVLFVSHVRTRKPALANARTISRPIPWAPPVTAARGSARVVIGPGPVAPRDARPAANQGPTT